MLQKMNHVMCRMVYIPSSIEITAVDYSLVQEGDDNVDINCQTIDGKNTIHAMARLLFQEQATDKAPTLVQIYLSAKPTVCSEAPKTVDAFESYMHCRHPIPVCLISMAGYFSFYSLMERSRHQVDIKHRTLPFLFGQDTSHYSPKNTHIALWLDSWIVDAKPSDMSTVYTVMKK